MLPPSCRQVTLGTVNADLLVVDSQRAYSIPILTSVVGGKREAGCKLGGTILKSNAIGEWGRGLTVKKITRRYLISRAVKESP